MPLLMSVQVPPLFLVPSLPREKAPLVLAPPLGGSSTLGFLASRSLPLAVARRRHKQNAIRHMTCLSSMSASRKGACTCAAPRIPPGRNSTPPRAQLPARRASHPETKPHQVLARRHPHRGDEHAGDAKGAAVSRQDRSALAARASFHPGKRRCDALVHQTSDERGQQDWHVTTADPDVWATLKVRLAQRVLRCAAPLQPLPHCIRLAQGE